MLPNANSNSDCKGDSCPMPTKKASQNSGGVMSSVNSVVVGSIIKSLSVPCFLLLMRTVYNPFYSSPQCLLRLVNETAPDHYKQHIYFRDMTYDDSCAGQNIHDYVHSQYNSVAQTESQIFQGFLALQGIIGFSVALYLLATKPFRQVLKNVIGPSFVIMHACAAVLSFSHVEQDILFTLGNVMHHTDLSKFTDLSNASMAATTPNGFSFSCIGTILWFFYAFYHMAPILRKSGYVTITGTDLVTVRKQQYLYLLLLPYLVPSPFTFPFYLIFYLISLPYLYLIFYLLLVPSPCTSPLLLLIFYLNFSSFLFLPCLFRQIISIWVSWAMYSIKFSHPLWHENFSEEWKDAMPFTHEYKGYKHVTVSNF